MIPLAYITAWRGQAPWIENVQVEQDLIISRALVEIFSQPQLSESFAFRGGTALYKLFINPPVRYSEDIDLVQIKSVPVGPAIDSLRSVLDSWLGTPKRKHSQKTFTLTYRFNSADSPPRSLKLKIEINTREHVAHFGFIRMPFTVDSPWYSGKAEITTYSPDELMATKLRALYQRKKGRDVFDLALALSKLDINPDRLVDAFNFYMQQEGSAINRNEFEVNLDNKLDDPVFAADIYPLLADGYLSDIRNDAAVVSSMLISRLL